MSAIPPSLPFVLGLEHAGTLMTPEEFDAIDEYDENYRYELINGVLVVASLPLADETDPNEELGRWLRNYREGHPQGSVIDSTLPQQYVHLLNQRRIADRLIWTGLGRYPDRRHDVPTIAVEFVSSGKRNRQRDYEEKRREYLALGIREYWIIDRFQRTMTVVTNDPAGIQERIVQENEVYETPLLPGFQLPLGRLIERANSWQTEPENGDE